MNKKMRPEYRPEYRSFKIMSSPIGLITLVADKDALLQLTWGLDENEEIHSQNAEFIERGHKILEECEAQLKEYFLGKRTRFNIPIKPIGTLFQEMVWRQLLNIPYGKTMSYGEQARVIGRSGAARAVGAANGKNPIGIIIPCHRVIGATGHLTGFAGGLDIKRKLLVLEGADFRAKSLVVNPKSLELLEGSGGSPAESLLQLGEGFQFPS